MTAPVITVDGPSGSGKGTVSRVLADVLGWHLLDSGALYRLTALSAAQKGVADDDVAALATVAQALSVVFGTDDQGNERVLLDGEDVSTAIRTESCGERASIIAALPAVREALVDRQRAFAQAPGLVADGRDMGTRIFPDSGLKVFLTASAEERADRRYKQLKEKGIDVNVATLLRDIEQRDRRDQSRQAAPLKPADDAVVIDSTSMSVDAVVDTVLALKNARLGLGALVAPD
ncbi:MAG: (d)CMP kinase [Pseudomonadota bacterium]